MAKKNHEGTQQEVASSSMVDVEFLLDCKTTEHGNFIAYQKAQLPADLSQQLEDAQVLIINK